MPDELTNNSSAPVTPAVTPAPQPEASAVPPPQPSRKPDTSELLTGGFKATETPPPVEAPAAPSQAAADKEAPGKEVEGKATIAPQTAAKETSAIATPTLTAPGTPEPDTATDVKRELEEAKAKIAAIEMERQKAEVRQLNARQTEDLQRVAAQVQANENSANLAYEMYKEAFENGDNEAASKYYMMHQTATQTAENGKYDYNNRLAYYQQSYQQTRVGEQGKVLEAELKQFGLSIDELKKTDPKLTVTDFFGVLRATNKTLLAKRDAEISALKEQLKNAESDARKKWETTSPAAIPDRATVGGAGAARPQLKPGHTNDLLLQGFNSTTRS